MVGASQQLLLETIKRHGVLTLREGREALGLSGGTVREHMKTLAAQGLVEQTGARRSGPGRPEAVYALTEEGHATFARKSNQLLTELVGFLLEGRQERLLSRFFEQRIVHRIELAERRLAGLRGRARLEEVARIMSDEGFMADVIEGTGSRRPGLRLCHCPFKEVVDQTQLPCRFEIAFIERLLHRSMERATFMPNGDRSCSYVAPSRQRRRTP